MKLTQQTRGRFPVNASWTGGTPNSGRIARRHFGLQNALTLAATLSVSWLINEVRAQTAPAPTVLANFSFYGTGANPMSGVVAGPDGNLYGVAYHGGADGGGTLFKYDGGLSLVTSFTYQAALLHPVGQIVFDPNRNIIGAVESDGLAAGAIYQYSFSAQTLSRIPAFVAPEVGLTFDKSGGIYGVNTGSAPLGSGLSGIFKLTGPSHQFSTVASLNETYPPASSVVLDHAGNFYGTTQSGGTFGKGSIFRVDAVTHEETTLHSFAGADGDTPMAGLAIDSHGNLFGTTSRGGPPGLPANGTVFEWSSVSQTFSTVYAFNQNSGAVMPLAPVVVDDSGNIFGTTSFDGDGGPPMNGTVFEIGGQTHQLTTLAQFSGVDGDTPVGPLLLKDGFLYGTTEYGGLSNQGVLYEVAAPEPMSIAIVIPFAGLLIRRRRVTS